MQGTGTRKQNAETREGGCAMLLPLLSVAVRYIRVIEDGARSESKEICCMP
jgi:hypothetical protein